MKFSVGYQSADPDETPFTQIVNEYRESIQEVYFSWMDNGGGIVSPRLGPMAFIV